MNTKNWKLKDVLLIAISAVLFGVVYLGCTYIGGVLYGMLTPFGMASLGYEPFYGIYFMAGAFGIYVMRGSYTTIYGAFAAIPVMLTWMYINWMFVLAGAAITATLPMLRAKRYKDFDKSGDELLSAVALLRILMLAKESGNPQMTNIELADKIGSYPEAVDALLSRLIQTNYVVKIGSDATSSWALLADAHSKTLEDCFEEFSMDMSNSLLQGDTAERRWVKEGLNDQWLQTPMREVLN